MILCSLNGYYLFLILQINMEGQQLINQQLLNSNFNPIVPQQHQTTVTDKLYKQAYDYYLICNLIIILYSIARVVTLPYFIIIEETKAISVFLYSLFIASALQLFTYCQVHYTCKNSLIFYTVAQETHHLRVVNSNQLPESIRSAQYRYLDIFDFTQGDSAEQDDRQVKVLALQIKFQIQGTSDYLQILSRSQFLIYNIVHVWGIILIVTFEFTNQTTKTYLCILIMLSTYQYIEFYLIFLFMVVILPFYGIRRLYQYIQVRYRAHQLQKVLESQLLSDQIKGDRDCKICLETYIQGDNIIVLKCNQMHNFHASCIREWAKNSSTCPLCRKNISDF